MRIDTPEEGAALIQAALQLNLDSGIVIGAHTVSLLKGSCVNTGVLRPHAKALSCNLACLVL